MQPNRRLQILSFIAQHQRCPSGCTSADMARLSGLVKFHAWPHMSLTPAGWAAIDRAGREALAQKTAS